MSVFAHALQRRMMRAFEESYRDGLATYRHSPGFTPKLSNFAQMFAVARDHATKNERLTPAIEKEFIDAAIEFARPPTGTAYEPFVEALNLKVLMKNPRSHEHMRELWQRQEALDAQHPIPWNSPA